MVLDPIRRALYCMGIAYYLVGSQDEAAWLTPGKLDLAFQQPWDRLVELVNTATQCRRITPEIDKCLALLYGEISLDHVHNTRYTVEQRGSWWQGYYKARSLGALTPEAISEIIPEEANQ